MTRHDVLIRESDARHVVRRVWLRSGFGDDLGLAAAPDVLQPRREGATA